MAPKRKTRNCLMVNRHENDVDNRIQTVAARKKFNVARRQRGKSNYDEWVYRFLGNLAAIENDKMKAKRRKASLRFTNVSLQSRAKGKKKLHRRFRSPTPYSWDRISPKSPIAALRNPVYSDSSAAEYDDDEDVTLAMISDNGKSLYRTQASTPNTSKAIQPIEKCSFIQRINRYIRAGIAEGKRRAKHYVRKALSFGLKTGYLIPADREGKLLRVSPALVGGSTQQPASVKKRSEGSNATMCHENRKCSCPEMKKKYLKRKGGVKKKVTKKKCHNQDDQNFSEAVEAVRTSEIKRRKSNEAIQNTNTNVKKHNEERSSQDEDKRSPNAQQSGNLSRSDDTETNAEMPAEAGKTEADRMPSLSALYSRPMWHRRSRQKNGSCNGE